MQLETSWMGLAMIARERLRAQAGQSYCVFLGDSRAQGYPYETTGGRPLINVGFPGACIKDLADLLPFVFYGSPQPRSIIVQIGVNDVVTVKPPTLDGPFTASADAIISTLKGIVGSRLAMTCIMPAARSFDCSDAQVGEFNARCATLSQIVVARALAAGASVFPLAPLVLPDGSGDPVLYGDVVHPNASGNAAIRPVLDAGFAGLG